MGHMINKEWTITDGPPHRKRQHRQPGAVGSRSITRPCKATTSLSVRTSADLGHPRFFPAAHRRRPGHLSASSSASAAYTFPIVNFQASRYSRRSGNGPTAAANRWWRCGRRSPGRAAIHRYSNASMPAVSKRFAASHFAASGLRSMVPRSAATSCSQQLEYQVPIRANDQLYAVAFVDSGTVESGIEVSHKYRVSAGVGLANRRPHAWAGAHRPGLRLPDRRNGPEDQTQIFSFWVGLFR